jgi:MerR family transcriptional regulator, light-induced transcriptional regulator
MDIQHPIKVVARRTGLSQHVIRVWEKRYGAVEPSRTATNRRLYSESEIERLHLLCQLTQAGHGICRIARLTTEQLRALNCHAVPPESVTILPARPAPAASSPEPDNDSPAQFLEEAMTAIRTLDDEVLDDLLCRASVELGHQGLLQKVIAPLTQRIGEDWEDGTIKVAHEHFASSVLRTFLCNHAKPCNLPESAPVLVVATPSGQTHELGAVLVAAAATNKGWRVKYLGTNLPACELSGAATQSKARAVALSVVYPDDDAELVQQFTNLRKYLPPDVAILVGGRAAESYTDAISGIGASLLTDLPQLNRKLDELRSSVPQRRIRGVE